MLLAEMPLDICCRFSDDIASAAWLTRVSIIFTTRLIRCCCRFVTVVRAAELRFIMMPEADASADFAAELRFAAAIIARCFADDDAAAAAACFAPCCFRYAASLRGVDFRA